MKSKSPIDELLTRGVEAIYPNEKFLRHQLETKKLTVYLGVDPTGPTLHLGHIVQLFKLRQFQRLGHQIILLIGDFTGMIGDPTDKSAVRKKLTKEQVLENCRVYREQASKIINFEGDNPAILKFNSEWLGKMTFADVVELASNFTVQRMLERDMFEKRMKDNKPIYVHEFMYPLMQGYDSCRIVEGGIDGEIGGNDQIFNMLAGRTLEKVLLDKEKFVLANKLLADNSGEKMGKTTGNMVALNQTPKDMFGSVMSWNDGLIEVGFEICTTVSLDKLKEVKKRLKDGENPRNLKVELARELVTFFFSAEDAERAEGEFDRMFKDKGTPDDMPELKFSGKFKVNDAKILAEVGMSGSEARRLVAQGGVKIDGEKVADFNVEYEVGEGRVVQFGKRKFVKIIS